jgi:hypothetical protein
MICLVIRFAFSRPRLPISSSITGGPWSRQLCNCSGKRPQFREQSLEPARVTRGFDPYAYLYALLLQLAVKPLRFFGAVHQRPFTHFSAVRLYPRDLLKTRVIITTYDQQVRLLSPEPWSSATDKSVSRLEADL